MTPSAPSVHRIRSAVSRRNFLRLAGLAGAAAAAAAGPGPLARVAQAAQRLSLSGPTLRRWSDPATWGGRLPARTDVAVITGRVLVDANVRVAGIVVRKGASLVFDPNRSVWMQSAGNVIVSGRLSMRPSSSRVVHLLTFTGAREGRFAGGGMKVLRSDVGLWVMGRGSLNLAGTRKLAWTRAVGDVPAGATSLELQADPAGWRVGDRLVIVPTKADDYASFDEVTVRSIGGRTVNLSGPVANAHPGVRVGDGVMTAEVLNLSRNVRIEGRPSGRAHIFIHSSVPQTIKRVAIRYMGPQQTDGGSGLPKLVLGRYGLHFHHCGNGSRRSLVAGVVVRDAGSHAFVPHMSNGVRFQDCIAYGTVEDPYWWDVTDMTNATVFERCVAASVTPVGFPANPRLSGFYLGLGDGNVCIGSVAVGIRGWSDASGYHWPNTGSGLWRFEDCVAHNNPQDGIFIWQNPPDPHLIERFRSYNSGIADIDHGSYINAYIYRDSVLASPSGLFVRAVGGKAGRPLLFERLEVAGVVVIKKHVVAGNPEIPTRFVECALTQPVVVDEGVGVQGLDGEAGFHDFIRCTRDGRDLDPSDFDVRSMHPGSLIRVVRADGGEFRIPS